MYIYIYIYICIGVRGPRQGDPGVRAEAVRRLPGSFSSLYFNNNTPRNNDNNSNANHYHTQHCP